MDRGFLAVVHETVVGAEVSFAMLTFIYFVFTIDQDKIALSHFGWLRCVVLTGGGESWSENVFHVSLILAQARWCCSYRQRVGGDVRWADFLEDGKSWFCRTFQGPVSRSNSPRPLLSFTGSGIGTAS